MDCGIPFCHTASGCPLGNTHPGLERPRLPRTAGTRRIDRLHATNNFPEFTGRLCPRAVRRRPACSASTSTPVTIKQIEVSIIDRGWDEGWVTPQPPEPPAPARRSPSSAPAPPAWPPPQQLNRAGHTVTVFERADRIGGLLRYGIPT